MSSNFFIEQMVEKYTKDELKLIEKALLFASEKHEGQFRKSGEPYIVHPISVAYMLFKLNADANTICAALLHDVVEDTDTTKEDLQNYFNDDIAELVDGVTKIKNKEHSSKEEAQASYIRKLTTSILSDVRIIIIKLMDRLHNMQTLSYQSEEKQKIIAKETLDIYVPLAYYLGIYRVRFLLEDLSLKYLDLEEYNKLKKIRNDIIIESKNVLSDMIDLLKEVMDENKISALYEINTKNIYGIYKRIKNGSNLEDIGDLLRIKIIVEDRMNCYQTLGLVHSLFRPVNAKFKDYISSPKTNRYQSLHTTVYTSCNRLAQIQIRSKEMNKINQFGIINAWFTGEKQQNIQNYLMNYFPFILILKEINETCFNDLEFMTKLKQDILKERIYVVMGNGNTLELPLGYTLDDLCNKLGITNDRLQVNNESKKIDYQFRNNDIISFTKKKVKKK